MLFDVVPENFFVPLASPGKRVYWECLERLFAITSGQLSFGVERDVLTNELEYYFDSLMAADFPEDEETTAEEYGKTARDRANTVIRKLENWGWISVETDKSYVQRVNFSDYAIKLMKLLEDISRDRHTEYQGYIYTIYSLAINISKSPGHALLQIVENTDMLITGLKSLNSNIKKYLDNLTKHTSVAELLKALLDDYYSNIVDKAYHRLLTSDNVSKFRPEIIERLESCCRRTQFINSAAIEIAQIKELSTEEAKEIVLAMLHEVITAFRQMDDILEDINLKNTKYQRAAVNRARFLLADSEDMQGQLKSIISFINEKAQQQAQDYNSIYELEETDKLIKIFSWEFIDINSLYSPFEAKKEFISQQLLSDEADLIERAERKRLLAEKLEKVLSPEKINDYVLKTLAGDNMIKASDTDLSNVDGFIRLIYIRLYGSRKNMSYTIVTKDMVRKNGYTFRDFQIIRKES